MKALLLVLALSMPATTFASVKGFNSSGLDLGHYDDIKCSTGVACSSESGKLKMRVYGAGTDNLAGFLSPVAATVASITGDLSITNCGATMTSDGSVIAIYNLPLASTAIGCTYTFAVGVDENVGTYFGKITVNPQDADQIVLLTNSAGDSITADDTGESVTLRAIGANKWAPVGKEQGTWTDAN